MGGGFVNTTTCSVATHNNGGICNHTLNCILFNSRSVCNKLADLYDILYNNNYDCIFITESWLKPTVPNSLLDPKNAYTIFRHDRLHRTGGGVCVLICKSLRCTEICVNDHLLSSNLVALDVNFNHIIFCFIVWYRPPSNSPDNLQDVKAISDIITRLSTKNRPLCVVGDINCKDTDWTYKTRPNCSLDEIIFDAFCNNGFSQCVKDTTRGTSLLDVVCLNEPLLLHSIRTLPPFGMSDHDSISFTLITPRTSANIDSSGQQSGTRIYLWDQGDYLSMSEHLSQIDWMHLLTVNLTPDDIWNSFREILDVAINTYVPFKLLSVRPASSRGRRRRYCPKPIWKLKNRKLLLYRAHKNHPLDTNIRTKYRQTCATYKRAVRNHEIECEKHILDANNIGAFYKYVNSKLTCRSGVGTLVDPSGNSVEDDHGKAELLNDYFCSVCKDDNGVSPSTTTDANLPPIIDSVTFEEVKLIRAALKIRTKCKTSPDHEGYPTLLITKLIAALSFPLSLIFNSFISVGKMPSSCKSAIVTPIFKKGLSSDPANYRPISKTSIFCKLMERVIVSDLHAHLGKYKLLCDHQHGFMLGKSTVTNLLETTFDLAESLDRKLTKTIIYIDFKKAFDSVSHPKLVQKLKTFGISGNLLSLIADFLKDRLQCTQVGKHISNPRTIKSGVIQGSCIGPILFQMFINDLPGIFNPSITTKMFADDVKMYACIHTVLDEFALQDALNKLKAWSDTWQLYISIHKCSALHITPSRSKITSSSKPSYFLGLHPLMYQNATKDLGIFMDEHQTFKPHINSIVKKSSAKSYLILKCFHSRDRNNLVKAFIVYVRPLLEYCSPIWSPHTSKYITTLENVQRRFTKKLPGMFYLSYPQRLNELKLDSLEFRRLRFDLILAYKIHFGLIKTTIKFPPALIKTTRGHEHKLQVPMSHTDHMKFFYTTRIVKIWNSLSRANFTTLTTFKNSLNKEQIMDFLTLKY